MESESGFEIVTQDEHWKMTIQLLFACASTMKYERRKPMLNDFRIFDYITASIDYFGVFSLINKNKKSTDISSMKAC